MVRMGCGTSQNAVVPVHYIENQNGSALRIDSPPKSEVLEYMSQEEVKDADDRSMQVCINISLHGGDGTD